MLVIKLSCRSPLTSVEWKKKDIIEVNGKNILKNILSCVEQQKEINAGLEKGMRTDRVFVFLGGIIFLPYTPSKMTGLQQ